jgi:hypothetical protein
LTTTTTMVLLRCARCCFFVGSIIASSLSPRRRWPTFFLAAQTRLLLSFGDLAVGARPSFPLSLSLDWKARFCAVRFGIFKVFIRIRFWRRRTRKNAPKEEE